MPKNIAFYVCAYMYISFLNFLYFDLLIQSVYLYRTDAGVHALGNTAHVELENKYNIIYNSSDVKKYVNRYFSKCGHTIR